MNGVLNTTQCRLNQKEFEFLSSYIYDNFGIKMPPAKKTLLECRLQKRLRVVGMNNFGQYLEYLFSREGLEQELPHMRDVVTTNKTDFFREPGHFEFIKSLNWSEYFGGDLSNKSLKLWSAGCSSGEEPYTLAMMLAEMAAFDYHITATDLSQDILAKAMQAVYQEEKVRPVSLFLKQKYFLKHKDPAKPLMRIIPELRRKVSFRLLNFMDTSYDMPHKYDMIFCRNVLIYFDRQTQENVVRKLCANLKEGGYLFIGHSESLNGYQLPLRQLKSTIFQKQTIST